MSLTPILVIAALAAVGTTVGPATSQPAAASGPAVSIEGVTDDAERRELQSWIDATTSVLSSPLFADRLRQTVGSREIFLRGYGRTVMGGSGDLLDILAAGAPGLRYVDTPVGLTGDEANYTAAAGWTGQSENNMSLGSMTLGRGHLERWRSEDPVQRSCAVNTLAHEISHTVSTHPSLYIHALDDTLDLSVMAQPVGSYLIGTVAQCTWLEQNGRIGQSDFNACVAIFSWSAFNSFNCDDFADDRPFV